MQRSERNARFQTAERSLRSIRVSGLASLAVLALLACGTSDESPPTGEAGSSSAVAGAASGGGGSATGGGGAGGVGDGGAGGVGGGGGASGGGEAGAGGAVDLPPAVACGAPVVSALAPNVCPNAPPAALKLTRVVEEDLFAPLLLISPPGDTARQFIVQREGVVRIVKDGALLPEPFLDISAVTSQATEPFSEYGLLGMAFDANYARNGRVWLHYVTDEGAGQASVVGHLTVAADNPDMVAAGAPVELLRVADPARDHKGGMIAFGPDHCLYTSFGDGGLETPENSQDPSSIFGKILRLDADNYPTPAPGNPGMTDPHIWDTGLRNPYRFAFDAEIGDLYIADVGDEAFEEIDVEPAGTGNNNYGWATVEGTACFEPAMGCDMTGMRVPAHSYAHTMTHAVVGGFVYRGAAIPSLVGRYLFGDYITKQVWTLTYSGESTEGEAVVCDVHEISADLEIPGSSGGISGFGQDASGEHYLLTLNGHVYRIDAE